MSPIPGSSLRRLNSGSAGCEFVAVVPIARPLRQRQPDGASCLEEHPDDESADTGRDRAILENASHGDHKPPTALLYRVQHDEPRDHSVAKPTCGLHGDFSIRRDRNALFANPEQSPKVAISPSRWTSRMSNNPSSLRGATATAQFSKAHVRIPAARFARVAHEACPSKTEGAGKAGCFAHPQPRVQSRKAHELVTTGPPKHSGFSCANGFNGFLRALSGDRLFLSPSPVRCASIVTRLNASVEASKPHDFAVRSLAHSSRAPTTSTGSRIHVRDDRDTPLL